MNLDEDDIMRLEIILNDLKENAADQLNSYPFIAADADILKHIVAKLKNTVCEDCRYDFSKENNIKENIE